MNAVTDMEFDLSDKGESKAPPAILIVQGTWDYRRARFIRDTVLFGRKAGWRILSVSGKDTDGISAVTETADVLFDTSRTLAVVEDPEKIPLSLLERHAREKDPATVLLLDVGGSSDGRTKFGKFCKEHPGTKTFDEPPPWKYPTAAAEFLVSEAARFGKKFDIELALRTVERTGVDFGMLAFEIDKYVMLATHLKSDTITANVVSNGIATIGAASAGPVVEALAARNVRALSQALGRMERTSRDDPTMSVCRLVGDAVIKWMQAAHLDKVTAADAAREIGVHPYSYGLFTAAARRWGKDGTIGLLRALAVAERAILNGAVSPWNVLVTGLMAACVEDRTVR